METTPLSINDSRISPGIPGLAESMDIVDNAAMDQLAFEPAIKTVGVQVLSRPSLSYWQDVWMRLKKNRQALSSLYIIILLTLFMVAGPYVWRVNPSDQDLSQISASPTLRHTAVVVPDEDSWVLLTAQPVPAAQPLTDASVLPAPANFQVIGEATTQRVRLKWDLVPGASGFVLYRNDHKPTNKRDLGLPMGDIQPDQVSFEDKLNLENKTYYYTIVATLNNDESDETAQVAAKLVPAIILSEAQKIISTAAIGDAIKLAPHPMGTDYLGRDLLSRLMEGGKVSMSIGFFASIAYIALGVLIGGISGYYGGKVDQYLMRFTDLVIALPFLLFMILFRIAFGVGAGESGVFPLIVALIALSWTNAARLTRGQVLQLRESEYVQAARLLGARPIYLIMRHLIPNTMGVILVSLTFAIPSTVFTEAFLSFIGMGVVPPTASWGSMCNDGIRTFLSHPHEFLFPALFISVAVLAFNLLGDGLQDALDPKMRARG